MRKHLPPFLLGFLALSFQIFLLREFSVHFYGNEITFGFILASWLLWGGLGSIIASKIRWDVSRLPYIYYFVILFFPVCLVILRFSRFFLRTLPGEITGITSMIFFSLALSFLISFPLGITFVFNAVLLKGNVTQVYLMESLMIYSFPNLSSSEESVHFALLQRPQAKNVLLIGGGAGGSLSQVLKYPNTKVDYVELDPEIIRLSLKYLPQQEVNTLKDSRVQIYFQDGRAYLKKTPATYDAIILNLPDPSTAQINRFYTMEFFSLVKKKLSHGGIFSFRVSSAENYISDDLQNFLASLYFTLKNVFPEIEIVPGNSNIFLASSSPISLDHHELAQKIDHFNLENTYVSSHSLFSRLSPSRLSSLKEKVNQGKKSINLDPHSWLAFFWGLYEER